MVATVYNVPLLNFIQPEIEKTIKKNSKQFSEKSIMYFTDSYKPSNP